MRTLTFYYVACMKIPCSFQRLSNSTWKVLLVVRNLLKYRELKSKPSLELTRNASPHPLESFTYECPLLEFGHHQAGHLPVGLH